MDDMMPMPISQTGHKKLSDELSTLEKEADDLRVRVAEAREMGDLKENGEYIYGRQNLGFVEGRMGEIRGKLNYSEAVDCTESTCDSVAFGSVVTVLDLDTEKEMVFQLLGGYDFDLTSNSISLQSPLGLALLDCAIGEKISVTVPRGEMNLKVLEIAKSEFK
jgi:transcription elongation factor GreA